EGRGIPYVGDRKDGNPVALRAEDPRLVLLAGPYVPSRIGDAGARQIVQCLEEAAPAVVPSMIVRDGYDVDAASCENAGADGRTREHVVFARAFRLSVAIGER